MVSALDSGSSGPGSSPDRGHCVVFLCLSPPSSRNAYWRIVGASRQSAGELALFHDISKQTK